MTDVLRFTVAFTIVDPPDTAFVDDVVVVYPLNPERNVLTRFVLLIYDSILRFRVDDDPHTIAPDTRTGRVTRSIG
jgi:hypothetical protein